MATPMPMRADELLSASQRLEAGLLVPVPALGEALDDPRVVETWHEALSTTLTPAIPHDILALWAHPEGGEPVLVGPSALAADELVMPRARPRIPGGHVTLVEEIFRDAGYASAAAAPVRLGRQDVGLVLVACFGPGHDDARTRRQLALVARRIAPTVARLADPHGAPRPEEAFEQVVDALARASSLATPRDVARAVHAALDRVVPLDRCELLVPGASPEQSYRISEHGEGALWTDARLVVEATHLDPAKLLAGRTAVHAADAREQAGWRAWARSGPRPLRSALAVALPCGDRLAGWLVAGHELDGAYDEQDLALLLRLAPFVGARLEALVQGYQLRLLRQQLGSAHAVPTQLRRMATVLATGADASAALREYAAEATAILPFHRVRFALDAEDGTVVTLIPGEHRPLAGLARQPVQGTLVGKVLAGEVPHGVGGHEGEVELVFPLRVSGRVTGALILTTATPEAFTTRHLALAQQMADTAAPFLELQRAGAFARAY